MTNSLPEDRSAQGGAERIQVDPNVEERAYLRRRALQEIDLAVGANDPAARFSHDQLAHAYCHRCQAIRNRVECEVYALCPLCQRLEDPFAE